MKKLIILFFALCSAAVAAGDYENLLGEGSSLQMQGKFGEALEKYREAISLEPKYVTAYYEALNAFFEMKAFDSSIVYAQKIVIMDSIPAEIKSAAYMTIGNSYSQLSNFEKSVQAFKSGIASDPNYQMLHFNLAVAYLVHGDMKEGGDELRKSLSINRSHPGSHFYYARMQMIESKRLPYLFAALAAIALENNSARAKQEIKNIQYTFKSLAISKADNKIEAKCANDTLFSAAEAIMAFNTSRNLSSGSDREDFAQFQKNVESLLNTVSMLKTINDEFFNRVYLDAFEKVQEEKLASALSRIVFAASGDKESIDWCEKNKRKVENCLRLFKDAE